MIALALIHGMDTEIEVGRVTHIVVDDVVGWKGE